ncbi:MAG: signal peptidase I [Myxococcota bacterium]
MSASSQKTDPSSAEDPVSDSGGPPSSSSPPPPSRPSAPGEAEARDGDEEGVALGPEEAAAAPPKLLRWLFFSVWLFAVPAALAVGAVRLLEPEPFDLDAGPIQSFVGEQQVPAIIMFFTLFAMVLWRLRYSLPFAASLGLGGRPDLPARLRPSFDHAQQLMADTRRVMDERRPELKPAATEALTAALTDLRRAMQARTFDPERFLDARHDLVEVVDRHLGRYRKSELREYAESISVAVIVALILRVFVVEAFKIPSGSMIPTLMVGDHIFVAKYAYGPLIFGSDTRLYDNLPPARGDVMVFKFPEKKEQDYIKRVIALPGDKLEVVDGRPVLNDWLVPHCYVGEVDVEKARGHLYVEFLGEHAYFTMYNERLPDETCARDAQCSRGGACRGGACGLLQGPYRVKDDEAWVMGDNRNNSLDSRMWRGGLGAGVPFENIKGRAMFVWFSWDQTTRFASERLGVDVMGAPKLPDGSPPEVASALAQCLRDRPSVADATPPAPKPRL